MSKAGPRLQDEGSRTQVVAAGATAGLISRFVIAPLDVVKIRLQLQTHSMSDPFARARLAHDAPIYKGTFKTLQQIVQKEGITALWKGNVPAELMYVSYAAVQFTTYRSMSMVLHRAVGGDDKIPKAAESFICGAVGGATATATTYPLDLLRTRFAAQGPDRVYTSLARAISQIYHDEGLRGFFRGLTPGLAQIVPYMGLFFAMYESTRGSMAQLELPFGSGDATSGVIGSVVAKTGVFPLDTVRKRIQVQGPTRALYIHKNIPEYSGTLRALRVIAATEGFRGLYRGLVVSLCKAAPASAVTMWTYERALHFYMGHGAASRSETDKMEG